MVAVLRADDLPLAALPSEGDPLEQVQQQEWVQRAAVMLPSVVYPLKQAQHVRSSVVDEIPEARLLEVVASWGSHPEEVIQCQDDLEQVYSQLHHYRAVVCVC
jgi:hypothetical protein